MNQTISGKHSLTYHILNCVWLEPGFTFSVINWTVSSKEWVEHSKLVELHVEILWWNTLVSRDVRTAEEHTRKSTRQQCVDWTLHLLNCGSVISSPIRTIFLASHEKATSQNESTSLTIISCKDSSMSSSVHHRSINIVDISVFDDCAINFQMMWLKRQCLLLSSKNRRLIHVIPNATYSLTN